MSFSAISLDLPDAWVKPSTAARLHILRAHEASRAVIIRRKPSKRFHLVAWDTRTDKLQHGSWFHGKIYTGRCDLSWDGRWMVYLAMGAKGETWNGICQPPWLRTAADVPNVGTWAGGGYFPNKRELKANDCWYAERSLSEFSKSTAFPFSIDATKSGGEDFPVLEHRLERDGWKREGKYGKRREISLKHSSYAEVCRDDPGWSWQPTSQHPVLRMYYRGWLVHGYTFEFRLDGSDLLDPEVDWATWDSKGDLLVARRGAIERYTLEGLKKGSPDFAFDLEELAPPTRDFES